MDRNYALIGESPSYFKSPSLQKLSSLDLEKLSSS